MSVPRTAEAIRQPRVPTRECRYDLAGAVHRGGFACIDRKAFGLAETVAASPALGLAQRAEALSEFFFL